MLEAEQHAHRLQLLEHAAHVLERVVGVDARADERVALHRRQDVLLRVVQRLLVGIEDRPEHRHRAHAVGAQPGAGEGVHAVHAGALEQLRHQAAAGAGDEHRQAPVDLGAQLLHDGGSRGSRDDHSDSGWLRCFGLRASGFGSRPILSALRITAWHPRCRASPRPARPPSTSRSGWRNCCWPLAFGMAGVMKSTQPMAELAVGHGLARRSSQLALVRFIGASELAAALGLVLPAATRIRPLLTPLAAIGLVMVMVLASLFHISRGEWFALPLNLVLGSLAAFVAWGRLAQGRRFSRTRSRQSVICNLQPWTPSPSPAPTAANWSRSTSSPTSGARSSRTARCAATPGACVSRRADGERTIDIAKADGSE